MGLQGLDSLLLDARDLCLGWSGAIAASNIRVVCFRCASALRIVISRRRIAIHRDHRSIERISSFIVAVSYIFLFSLSQSSKWQPPSRLVSHHVSPRGGVYTPRCLRVLVQGSWLSCIPTKPPLIHTTQLATDLLCPALLSLLVPLATFVPSSNTHYSPQPQPCASSTPSTTPDVRASVRARRSSFAQEPASDGRLSPLKIPPCRCLLI
jgi:hypothetical protein